jgi:predicted metal-dependent phosphoesterase TrpH
MTARPKRHDPLAPEGRVIPPDPSTIDLHAHTDRSDGVLAPVDLVAAAFDAGVRIFALTDHDTLAGYRDTISAGVVPAGMTLLTGVEINALVTRDIGLWEGELHILGFGMDPGDEAFEAVLMDQRDQRRRRFDRTIARLRELDMPIEAQVSDLRASDDDALGRPTIARALMAAGHASSVEDAFSRWLGHGAPAYIRRDGLEPDGAIRAIVAAGGVPVLAHFREAPTRIELLRELIDVGLAGLEVHYRSFDRETTTAVAEVARRLGLLMTGGTDYHGDLGTYAEAHASLWVPPAVGDRLIGRLDQGAGGG